MDSNNNPNKYCWFVIFYKILNDILFLMLAVFFMALLADGAIPGFFSVHLSFTRITLLIFGIISLIILIQKKIKMETVYDIKQKNRSIIWLAIFLIILTINSLLKFSAWEIIVITLSTLFIFFFFYKIIFNDEKI